MDRKEQVKRMRDEHMRKGQLMKDGGMDRDPHAPEPVKTWKRGEAETIQKGAERSPAKSNGMHGMKGDAVRVVRVEHVHYHVGRKEKK